MIAATGVDESSLHYRGWRVVLACFLMAFFMFGFGLYGQGVYLAELQRAHGSQAMNRPNQGPALLPGLCPFFKPVTEIFGSRAQALLLHHVQHR